MRLHGHVEALERANGDVALVQACRRGSLEQRTAAFAVIVERYRGLVMSTCYAAVGNYMLGQDLAQDTFVVAWQKLEALSEPSLLRPWLATIARNLSRNARRRMREVPTEHLEACGAVPSPADELIHRESTRAVRDALLQIPTAYRETLVLFYWEGQSSAQVADRLGISEAAVQQRLCRARRLLKQEIEHQLVGDLDRQRHRDTVFTAAVVAAITGAAGAMRPAHAASPPRASYGWLVAVAVGGVAVAVALYALVGRFSSEVAGSEARAAPARASGVQRPSHRVESSIAPRGEAGEPYPSPGHYGLVGVVVDDTYAPVEGATVRIDSVPPRGTISDARGMFRFDDLVDRTYTLTAHHGDDTSRRVLRHPAVQRAPMTLQLVPGATLEVAVIDRSSEAPVAGAYVELGGAVSATTGVDGRAVLHGVAAGAAALLVRPADDPANTRGAINVQVAITARPGEREHTTVALPRGAPILGTVTRRGAPVAGVTVVAEPVYLFYSRSLPPVFEMAITDRDGRWRLPGLPANLYSIMLPGRAARTLRIDHDGVTSTENVALELDDGRTLTGRVVSTSGAAVPYATIELALSPDPITTAVTGSKLFDIGAVHGMRRELTCDRNGEFRATDLPREELYVRARAGDATSIELSIDGTDGPLAPVTLTIDHARSLDGVVVHDDGAPAPGAQVVAISDTRRWYAVADRIADVADGEGRFHLGGLGTGRYLVYAAPWDSDERAFTATAGVAVEPATTTGPPVRIVVHDSGSVRGQVRFADGTTPARYEVAIGTSPPLAVSASDGAFEIADLPAGRYDIAITGAELIGDRRDAVEVHAGAAIDLGVVTVQRASVVRGRVVANGHGVAGAQVTAGRLIAGGSDRLDELLALTTTAAHRTRSGPDGAFTLPGTGPEVGYVVADHPDLGRSQPVRISPGDTAAITLALQPTGSLEGRVWHGTAGAATGVYAIPIDGPGDHTADGVQLGAVTDNDGRYHFTRLAPGAYQLSTYANPRLPKITVRVEPATTTSCDLHLPLGALVTAAVEWSLPAENARVVLISGDRQPRTAAELDAIAAHDHVDCQTCSLFAVASAAGVLTQRTRFEDVGDGPHTLCAYAAASGTPGAPVCRLVDIQHGAAQDVSIVLPPVGLDDASLR